jgi:hypothetical protein
MVNVLIGVPVGFAVDDVDAGAAAEDELVLLLLLLLPHAASARPASTVAASARSRISLRRVERPVRRRAGGPPASRTGARRSGTSIDSLLH